MAKRIIPPPSILSFLGVNPDEVRHFADRRCIEMFVNWGHANDQDLIEMRGGDIRIAAVREGSFVIIAYQLGAFTNGWVDFCFAGTCATAADLKRTTAGKGALRFEIVHFNRLRAQLVLHRAVALSNDFKKGLRGLLAAAEISAQGKSEDELLAELKRLKASHPSPARIAEGAALRDDHPRPVKPRPWDVELEIQTNFDRQAADRAVRRSRMAR